MAKRGAGHKKLGEDEIFVKEKIAKWKNNHLKSDSHFPKKIVLFASLRALQK